MMEESQAVLDADAEPPRALRAVAPFMPGSLRHAALQRTTRNRE
jgi:hypothetical protein